MASKPRLSERRILAWADAYHERAGKWPKRGSGRVREAREESWSAINHALYVGLRSLAGGSSLARLLALHRGVRNHMNPPPLSVPRILAWADEHYRRSGAWPTPKSGPVREAPGDSWNAIDLSLKFGRRKLPGGSSLVALLAEHRGRRSRAALPRLTHARILAWADAHHQRTGDWPHVRSGPVEDGAGATWSGINSALLYGRRGLPGGCSLAQLLTKHRGVRNPMAAPRLTPKQILTWAEAYHRRTGGWPNQASGPVSGVRPETWKGLDSALRDGCRGLPGRSSLAQLIARRYGEVRRKAPPRGITAKTGGRTAPSRSRRSRSAPLRLSHQQILSWADAHHRLTGRWPSRDSGPVKGAPDEWWSRIDGVLKEGFRGLSGGESLARLLARCRGVRHVLDLPVLSVERILAWADAHHRRTGTWPMRKTGPVKGAPGEHWSALDSALRVGSRGLAAGSSLAQLLEHRRGVRNRTYPPPLRISRILAWADRYRAKTGLWPKVNSPAGYGAPEESWTALNTALSEGLRGLPGGSSLAQLLAEHRGVRNLRSLPRLTVRLILAWADAHRERARAWPRRDSGPVRDAPGERWSALDSALRVGSRGVPGGSSLAQLLKRYRPVMR